jgi:hypothetical protein
VGVVDVPVDRPVAHLPDVGQQAARPAHAVEVGADAEVDTIGFDEADVGRAKLRIEDAAEDVIVLERRPRAQRSIRDDSARRELGRARRTELDASAQTANEQEEVTSPPKAEFSGSTQTWSQ